MYPARGSWSPFQGWGPSYTSLSRELSCGMYLFGCILFPWPFIFVSFQRWVGRLLPKLIPHLAVPALSPQDGSLQCPTCKTIYGVKTGTQPPGKMEYHLIPHSLPGHPDCKTIRIVYSIPPGIQVSPRSAMAV